MKYMRDARNAEYGKAEIELYDKETGKVVNRVSLVDDDSCLQFLESRKTVGYSDISGVTCEMVMTVTTKDGNGKEITKTGHSIVEMMNVNGNYVTVKINGSPYTVYKNVAKFYKI